MPRNTGPIRPRARPRGSRRPHDRSVAAGAALAAAVLAASVPGSVQAAPATPCAELARLALPEATVTAAESVAAGGYQPPAGPLAQVAGLPGMNAAGHARALPNPAFCRIAATLRPSADSAIRIEVWLPEAGWNGKFLGVGSFGWGGAPMSSGMLAGLAEGYATASTDTGHDADAPDGRGGRFALGHPEKLIDYAHRADHLMTVRAKTLVAAFYGMGPERSYWIGCSLGGLEGLIEAKRYPEDYDGIVAGAPPNPLVAFNAAQLWPSWLVRRDPGAAIPREAFAMVQRAMIAACASPVGRAQGFVEEPDRCGFEPRHLLCRGENAAAGPDCLTAKQVELLDRIYRGPVDPVTGRVIFPGPAKGGEAGLAPFADGRPFSTALDLFRYAAFQDPAWDGATMDWHQDVDAASETLGALLHVDADLRPFLARGGKLLLYIGWNDYHNPSDLIAYREAVVRTAGPRGADAVRLFTVPGMGHCFGGAGCDTFDKLGVIDAWVSSGTAPERIEAAKVAAGEVVRTRPLCAHPKVARYDGHGNPAEASSFLCAD